MRVQGLSSVGYHAAQNAYEGARRYRHQHPRDFTEMLERLRDTFNSLNVDPVPYVDILVGRGEKVYFGLAVRIVENPETLHSRER